MAFAKLLRSAVTNQTLFRSPPTTIKKGLSFAKLDLMKHPNLGMVFSVQVCPWQFVSKISRHHLSTCQTTSFDFNLQTSTNLGQIVEF